MSIKIWLPPRFLQDREERALDNGIELARHKSGRVWLELTEDQFEDISSDAEFQAYHADNAPRGVKASARVTLRAIHAIRCCIALREG